MIAAIQWYVPYSTLRGRLYSKGFDIVFLLATQSRRNHRQRASGQRGKVGDDPSAARGSAIDMKRVIFASYFLRSGRNHGVSSWITNCTL
ncbi:hypothetical protein TNCV_2576711 [Trichonephila clavipes]|nr:hypothetical protein TNCV_2576711 [Trichonephila clavipes]